MRWEWSLRHHQKLKFAVGGLLVIVSGEEDMLVSCPSSAPYVEAAEESLETAFQSFEVVSYASVEPSPLLPSLSNAAIMVTRVMLKHEYEPGMGLGKVGLGNADVVNIKGNPYKCGLGYEPGIREGGMRRQDSGRIGHGPATLANVSPVPESCSTKRWQQSERSASRPAKFRAAMPSRLPSGELACDKPVRGLSR